MATTRNNTKAIENHGLYCVIEKTDRKVRFRINGTERHLERTAWSDILDHDDFVKVDGVYKRLMWINGSMVAVEANLEVSADDLRIRSAEAIEANGGSSDASSYNIDDVSLLYAAAVVCYGYEVKSLSMTTTANLLLAEQAASA